MVVSSPASRRRSPTPRPEVAIQHREPNRRQGTTTYVALGDSISIDDYAGGPGRGGASLLARNHDRDIPQWRGRDLGDASWANLATDGATTTTLLDVQLPRLRRLGLEPSLVTLTVGGNDVLVSYGDTRAVLRTVHTVGERVARALEALHELTRPDPSVVVATVYDPSDGTGDPPPADRDLWYCDIIEPNAWGASGVRAAL